MKEKQYALMFDGTEHDDILAGTAEEVGRRYLEIEGGELKVAKDEDGYLGYFIRFTDDEEDWEEYDGLDDHGSWEANLKAAYMDYFLNFLKDEEYDGYRVFELDTPGKAELFQWTNDEVLDHITAREFRDAGLDYEDEFETRCWYYENKCQTPKAQERKAA